LKEPGHLSPVVRGQEHGLDTISRFHV
jgi:hypothetical protein